MRRQPWVKVGTIGIDAGLCMIGDPCYTIDGAKTPEWNEFLDKELDFQNEQATQTYKDVYVLARGIVTGTGFGDGEYPVYVRRGPEGRVAAVKVVFIPSGLR